MGPTIQRATKTALLAATASSILFVAAGCAVEGDGDHLSEGEIGGARVSWGEPANGDPVGLLMLIHGGGWKQSDAGFEQEKVNAEGLRDSGFATVAVDYDQGADGFRQIVEVYQEAGKRYPDLPICATGGSAGGHLSLMLATREPDLDCVLAVGAPTDLTTIGRQDPDGAETYRGAAEVFGKDRLAEFSPARHVDKIKAKVLLIAAETDPLVPAAQSRELAQLLPDAQLLVLPPGPVAAPFAHFGGVQSDAPGILVERELEFLEEVAEEN